MRLSNLLMAIASIFFSILNINAEKIFFKAYNCHDKLIFEKQVALQDEHSTLNFKFNRLYENGDYFVIEGPQYMNIQLDSNIRASNIYTPNGKFKFIIPNNENGINYPEKSFTGVEHKISIKTSTEKEKSMYRNVALNSFDIRGNSNFYPHATSNSECRSESFYAARNAIDGNKTNIMHGKWPYQSWGPDKGVSLWFKIDFGRMVEIDKLVIVNRAQYIDLHDSYWNQAIVEYSDGKMETIKIEKTDLPQEIKIKKHKTTWVKFSSLKAQEQKWCSWIEVEAWGIDLGSKNKL